MFLTDLFIDVRRLPEDGYGWIQLLFLLAVYGYILMKASTMIKDGSELLLLIPSWAGLVGPVVLPVLGSIPDAAIILFSGIGEDAQHELSVGVGALAGSTVMLLTVPWAAAVFFGRVDLDVDGNGNYVRPRGSKAKKGKFSKLTRKFWNTGVNTGPAVRTGSFLLLVTLLPYVVVQVPAAVAGCALKTNEDSDKCVTTVAASFAGAVAWILLFFYLWREKVHADDTMVADMRVAHVQQRALSKRLISLRAMFHLQLEKSHFDCPRSRSIHEARSRRGSTLSPTHSRRGSQRMSPLLLRRPNTSNSDELPPLAPTPDAAPQPTPKGAMTSSGTASPRSASPRHVTSPGAASPRAMSPTTPLAPGLPPLYEAPGQSPSVPLRYAERPSSLGASHPHHHGAMTLRGMTAHARRTHSLRTYNDVARLTKDEAAFCAFLRPYFRRFDRSGSGYIDRHELRLLVEALGEGAPTDHEIDDLMAAIDIAGSGSIDFEEFVLAMREVVADPRCRCFASSGRAARIQRLSDLRQHNLAIAATPPTADLRRPHGAQSVSTLNASPSRQWTADANPASPLGVPSGVHAPPALLVTQATWSAAHDAPPGPWDGGHHHGGEEMQRPGGWSTSAGGALLQPRSATPTPSVMSMYGTEAGEDDEVDGNEHALPEELSALEPHIQQRRLKLRAFPQMIFGTILVIIFSDPAVKILSELGRRLGVGPFYVAFLLAPLVSNGPELLAAVAYGSKKTEQTIAVALATLLGSAVANNTLCLGTFLVLVAARGLRWTFTAEVISIVAIEMAVGLLCLTFGRRTFTATMAGLVLAMYPLAIVLTAGLEQAGLD